MNNKILYRINNFAVVDRDDEFGEMDDIGLPLSDVASFGLRDTMVAGNGIIDLPDIGYKTNGKYITIRQHPDMPQNAIYKHVDYPEYNPDNHYYWIIDLHRDSIVEGPVNYQSFKNRCALLHIEDSLTLFKQ